MRTDPTVIEKEMEKLMNEQIFGFNTSKLDAIQQVKNVTAVVVRTYVPNVVPPQTGWIWVDTVGGKSYISTGTNAVSDWGLLWTIGWSVVTGKIAVGNAWGLTSYTALSYTTATQIFGAPIINAATEYRVSNTKVVGLRQTAAYTWDDESTPFTGINNAQAGTPYAQLTDLNALRVAYEALRDWYENLRTALQTHGLIS